MTRRHIRKYHIPQKVALFVGLVLSIGFIFLIGREKLPGRSIHVYIEDNHAGSFFFLENTLDPASSYHLINIDAHSDTTPLPKHASPSSLQCFNWIHGLTPRPFSGLTWVFAMTEGTAARPIPAHVPAETSRWFKRSVSIIPLSRLEKAAAGDDRLVVSIDLDFFVPSRDPVQDVRTVFRLIRRMRRVDCITIAVSRPYLPDDEFAFRILAAVIAEIVSLDGVERIGFEPFLRRPVDTSRRAQAFRARGRDVPRFDLTKAPGFFKALLGENRERFAVREDQPAWDVFLEAAMACKIGRDSISF